MPPPRKADSNRWYRSGLFVDSRNVRADEDTQFATQLQRSPGDYLGALPDVGRVVGNGVRELFISCEIGDALQQQFEHLRPTCIVLHDLGCTVSRRLLAAVAAASGQQVERLVVRRQGFGTIVATLEYIDCATTQGKPMRLYSTDADADSQSRQSISRVLLGNATLAAVLLGDLPSHALTELLEPLRIVMLQQPARCQQMLFMPLGPGPAAGNAVHERLHNLAVQALVSPRVTMPAEAWGHLHSCWNQLQRSFNPASGGLQLAPLQDGSAVDNTADILPLQHGPAANSASVPPAPPPAATLASSSAQPQLLRGYAPTEAGALQPLPAPRSMMPAAAAPVPQPNPLAGYLRGLGAISGVITACVFEVQTSRVLAHLGTRESAVDLAKRGTVLLAASGQARKQLQMAGQTEEVVVRGGAQSLGLRVLVSQPEWAVHLVFSPAQCDWTHLRVQLVSLDEALQRGPVF
jgi:hypothetical protein